mgnify:CR=1 FL=1
MQRSRIFLRRPPIYYSQNKIGRRLAASHPHPASLAAERITERQLRRLEDSVLEEERAFYEKNLELYLEVNENFHRAIAEASGNRILAEYVENILARTNVYIVFYDPFYNIETNPSIPQHRAIIGALSEKSPEKAEALMREHLRFSMEDLQAPKDTPEF